MTEFFLYLCAVLGTSQVVLVVKNLPANAGDANDSGSIPGSGRSLGVGSGKPFQYSYLENLMDKKPGRLQSMGPQRVRHQRAVLNALLCKPESLGF